MRKELIHWEVGDGPSIATLRRSVEDKSTEGRLAYRDKDLEVAGKLSLVSGLT